MTSSDVHAAFVESLGRHRGILLKVANAYCRDRADREDLVQEIVVQLWRSYPRYDGRAALSTWMYRVALNVAISFQRSQLRKSRNVEPAEHAVFEALASPEPVETDERIELLHQFIDALGPLDRALMILYLDDRSHTEIAAILGISETNVGTKISRIKVRLKHNVAATANDWRM